VTEVSATARPSAALEPAAWERVQTETVDLLRDLIRIPSINPPEPAGPETAAASFVAEALADAGIPAEIVEPVPGRGSVAARLRGDGTGGEPLLLLSHLDVVPAPAAGWSHDPFGGDLADGYVWGRGAVDMKEMVAMEIAVMRRLAAEARAAGRDPTSDPVPGLRRDLLFCSTADEEAGGLAGAGWIVENRPDLVSAAGALNEGGGVSFEVGRRRFYAIGTAEKGYAVFRFRVRGTWGHGSMPRDDNAAVRAAEIVRRVAVPGPVRMTPLVARLVDEVARELPPEAAEAVRSLRGECDPTLARVLAAIVRDTASPDVVHAGYKYNVIPGEAIIEIDCRTLPGSDGETMETELRRRIGDELWGQVDVESVIEAPAVEAPAAGELYDACAATLRDHDPEGVPVPVMAPFATDAKHLARIGVPSYGFIPLRLDRSEPFVERFHGTDERVAVDALRFGVPVLYDVVRRFCG
jgi:acetylornithine deacetylase/succinyl-diaminopimelate desuccinylase-like protein